MRFVTRSIEPIGDPLGLDPTAVWMAPEISLWGWGEAARFGPGTGPDRIEVGRHAFAELIDQAEIADPLGWEGTGPVVVSSMTFADGSAGSVAVVPRVVVGRRGEQWWMTSADGAVLPTDRDLGEPPTDRVRYAGSSLPDVEWLEAVAEAVRRIEGGLLDKVVLARDYAVWSREQFHPPRLLRQLHGRFPGCMVFRVADLIGASPELLVRRHQGHLDSLILAGSAPSYSDPDADEASGAGLVASVKNQWEHELAVRSVRAALSPVTGSLTMADHPTLLRLDNVQHLATPVTAEIVGDFDALALAGILHPTAAVGGTPTPQALAVIAEIEGMDRGRYAGPVGWMDWRGDGEFAIALRCAELSGARARLFAGAGIVTGSLPEAELEETRIKLQAMMGALEAG